MNDKPQMKRPLKGLSHILASNTPKAKIALPIPTPQLPQDMYLHTPNDCPTEWWWHTGTLKADDNSGRIFGFEINASAFYPAGFTEVMLTDVKNQKHYHQTKINISIPDTWAESDPSKEWQVNLENVTMKAPQSDPTQNMVVTATILDKDGTKITFNLTLSQNGSPLMVWGTGVNPPGPPEPTLSENNFYFSLTRLHVEKGSITITPKGGETETISVSGVTWMDHEWGKFSSHGKSIKWILQDMQLSNGICISNYSLDKPVLNTPNSGMATVQKSANSTSDYVVTTMTPKKSVSIGGKEYFTEVFVEIPDYNIKAFVKSLMPKQVFKGGVYEGVATVSAEIKEGAKTVTVDGTAWMEQTN